MSLGESNSIAPKASACPGTWGTERSGVTTAAVSSPPQKQTWLQPSPPRSPTARGAAASPCRVIAPEGDALLETEQTPQAQRQKSFVIRFLPQG